MEKEKQRVVLDGSIAYEKQRLRQEYRKGTVCGCCGQMVKLYKRRINTVMVRTLVQLYKLNRFDRKGYYHVSEIVKGISETGTNDFSKLKYWELIREKPKDDDNTKTRTSGYWQIGGKGVQFIFKKIKLPEYVLVFNKETYGFTGKEVTISECLSNKFNYDELMDEYIKVFNPQQIGMNL